MYWYHFLIRVEDAVAWSEGEEGGPGGDAVPLPPPAAVAAAPGIAAAPTDWQVQWPLTPQPTPCSGGGGTSLLARSGAQPGPQLAPQPGPQLAGSSSDSPAVMQLRLQEQMQAQQQMQAQVQAQQMQMQAMQVQMR